MNVLKITRTGYNECELNGSQVDPKLIIKNKVFHNDVLNEDFTVKESSRDSFLIGGVLKLRNNYTFGTNDKGMELFEFQPINWRYPRFMVPSNIKKNLIKNKDKVIDHFVVISFRDWKSKFPVGMISLNLGPVDVITNQYDVLFYYYPTMPITMDKKSKDIGIEYNEPSETTLTDEIYSIDPEGCIDIDDAISYDNEKKRIGVHIADVAEILKEYNHQRYSTVYAPHRSVHMIPDEIATEMASLREGKVKNVITCWINEDSSYNFECNKVRLTKNLTYDQADVLINTSKNAILKMLYVKSIEIGKSINIEVPVETIDTHKMVEVYMIFYNKSITEHLEGEKNMIFRNQKLFKKAVYEHNRIGHESLGLSHYTHATSPIRRYTDWIVQKIFKKLEIGVINLERVNEYEREIKKLSRMWDYLKASKEMTSGSEYELEFREIQDDRLVFFCEKLNIQISSKIKYNIVENGVENDIENRVENGVDNVVDTVEVNGSQYKLGEKYTRQLYLIDDKKNILFYKILIQY
jgi:exoribonuclease R